MLVIYVMSRGSMADPVGMLHYDVYFFGMHVLASVSWVLSGLTCSELYIVIPVVYVYVGVPVREISRVSVALLVVVAVGATVVEMRV